MRALLAVLLLAGASSAAPPPGPGPASEVLVSSGTAWPGWLAANFPLKRPLSKAQLRGLETFVPARWDARFVGDIYLDGTPGALLIKFSPAPVTAAQFAVLRWTRRGWKTLVSGSEGGLYDAKNAAITESGPVAAYRIDLRRKPKTLSLMITLGDAQGLYGDVIPLEYDPRAKNFVWPDAWSDHD